MRSEHNKNSEIASANGHRNDKHKSKINFIL